MTAFSVFETAIGTCALRWRGDVASGEITGFLLPCGDEDGQLLEADRRWRVPVERRPPRWVEETQSAVAQLFHGERRDLTWVPIALPGVPAFHRTVYEVTRAIPVGQTMSYGEVAALAGAPRGAQAVGYALGHNPIPVIIPCHRVLAANGELHGFSAPGGIATKRKMLELEGVVLNPQTELFGGA